jgi:phosphoribosyl 1,2-cyclic phosphodiesterase
MIRVTFLGSGSGGNSTLVAWGSTSVLVDAGFSAREIALRLKVHGDDVAELRGIFVTHEHRDHARGLRVLQKRTSAPIFASHGTVEGAHAEGHGPFSHELLGPGETVRIGDLRVTAFPVSHDAREPLGFVFEAPDGCRLGYATDVGVVTPHMAEALVDCDLLALETNHDPDMLAHGPYPWFLKRRIAGDNGHLSNDASADALGTLASDRTRHVFAIHVSRTNNTPELAAGALRQGLRQAGLDSAVSAVSQDAGLRFPDRQASLF